MRLWCARWIKAFRVGLVAALVLLCAAPQCLRGEVLTLKNGTSVEGALGKVGSLGNPLENAGNGGEIALKRIVVIDDQLRRTFVGTNQVAAPPAASVVTTLEKVKIPQRVAAQGNGIVGVGPIVRVTPFDEWGRRIFTMSTSQGNVDVIQGITEITPTFTKVEAIQGRNNYVWTMPIGTSTIPRETLSKILMHRIDPKNADERLRIVRLYLQSERIQDARMELEKLIADFPELQNLKDQVRALNQMAAQRLIKEIELRRAAGQHQLAYTMLSTFPADGVAGETLLKVRDSVAEYDLLRSRGDHAIEQLKQHLAEIKDEAERARAQPICDEITSALNIHTIDRLADYLRLADDADMAPEQKLALAFSGWILGSGSGIDSLPTAQSLYAIRGLVRRYLISTRKPDRDAILAELNSLEGSTPSNLAKIIGNMTPPVETPVAPPPAVVEEPEAPRPTPAPAPVARPGRFDKSKKAALRDIPSPLERPRFLANQLADAEKLKDEKKAPNANAVLDNARPPAAPAGKAPKAADKPKFETAGPVTFAGAPGLLRITTPGLSESPVIEYHVQLPPEYTPNRRYPVVMSLNGSGTTPVQQIDWWAGAYNSESDTRYGQGTRHGYIIIAPTWLNEHQQRYEYTAREHAAVLYTLRDACKRFSVDTDKVFLSGHSVGGDAAWDIGLAHPDLWAGVIPIVAMADKYVPRYWQNAADVPMYFVNGEKDGSRWMTNASEWDRYLTKAGCDVTVVQYQGRGHEHFYDEIQRLFEWMNEHRRNFFPKEFKVVSMRPWDNFFWYVEVSQFPPSAIVMPVQWPPGRGAYAAETEAKLTTTNLVRVQTAASKVIVYLSPDMIDFNARATVSINGKKHANVQPAIEVLLEDVRTRGDRLHPFWAKVEQ